MLRLVCVFAFSLSVLVGTVSAQDDDTKACYPWRGMLDLNPRTGFFGYHRWETSKEPLPPDERLARAGCPHVVAPWARCPDDRHYVGYYVGGGATFGGEPRCYQCEGTWGRDYKLPWSRLNLQWFHGRRHQGGEGQYNPDHKNNPLTDLSDH